MKTKQKYLKVGTNNSSLILRLTEQLKELGLDAGDRVYTYIENDRITIVGVNYEKEVQ